MEPLDLTRAEERLVDSVPFARDDNCRRTRWVGRVQGASLASGLGRGEQSFAGVQRLLRAAVAIVEPVRRAAVDLGEVVPEQARHGAPKAVNGLVRIPHDHEVGSG